MDTAEELVFFHRVASFWASSAATDAGYHVTLLKAMIRSCTASAVEWNGETVLVFIRDRFWSDERTVLLTLGCVNRTVTSIQCSACCLGGTSENARALVPPVLRWRCYHSYFFFLHLLGNKTLATDFFFFHGSCHAKKLYFDFPMQTEDMIAALVAKFSVCMIPDRRHHLEEENQAVVDRDKNESEQSGVRTCGICFDPCADTFFAWRCQSGHPELFHGDCIVKWFERELNCPLCRKTYNVLELFTLKTKQIVTRKLKIFTPDFCVRQIASGRSAEEAIDLT
jgi:hypothetical protein